MQEEFDVIVVGAGPAGGQCARELSRKGWKVILIEKNNTIGEPNFSSAGTTNYLLEEFSLPNTIVGNYWDKLKIVSPFKEYIWNYSGIKGYVLKFDELKKFLVKNAENYGCKVLCGDSVESVLIENEEIKGVILENSKVSIKGKIIVDASGPSGVIASKIGLRKKVLCTPSEGLEYIMTGVSFPQENVLSFYLGKKFAPDGYAWIFPMGPNLAKAGVAVYDASKYLKGRHIIDILKNFVSQVSWLNSAKPVELHGGSIYIKGGIKNYVFSNVLSIGDSGSQINPLGGEGIRHAMRAGRMASKSIDKALKTGVNSCLLDYQKEWKNYVKFRWKFSQFITQLLYHRSSDKLLDGGFQLLQLLSSDDVFDILFEYKYKKAFNIIKPKYLSPFNLAKVARVAFSIIKN